MKKTILLAVTGSIAAIRVPNLIRALQEYDFSVQPLLTDAACHFVGKKALSALSGNAVWNDDLLTGSEDFAHITRARDISVVLVAPATADTLARFAGGHARSMLEAIALVTRAPILMAPAMNGAMLTHPAVQRNITHLKNSGVEILRSQSGILACGEEGMGKMEAVASIALFAKRSVTPQTLAGKKVLITLGATREPLDPVRFLSNGSSGKMGLALARSCFLRGAQITIIAGYTEENIPDFFEHIVFTRTAKEMKEATINTIDHADIAFFVAAVADFSPEYSKEKRSQYTNIRMQKNEDIAALAGLKKKKGQQFFGFALQSDRFSEAEKKARAKMKHKNLDGIILNFPENIENDIAEVFCIHPKKIQKISGKKSEISEEMLSFFLS